MRSLLRLMQAHSTQTWSCRLMRHLRNGLGAGLNFKVRRRAMCVMLCLRRAVAGMPLVCAQRIVELVMLEDVWSSFQALAQEGAPLEMERQLGQSDEELASSDSEASDIVTRSTSAPGRCASESKNSL
mmetsp:Transcript_21840/g.29558  ORF Transcript_21840/g.29558 Transcript_21840/m.29558 type:complete len:128 (-) Transcript_21840:12-395(-)